jgi:hypothetical protein
LDNRYQRVELFFLLFIPLLISIIILNQCVKSYHLPFGSVSFPDRHPKTGNRINQLSVFSLLLSRYLRPPPSPTTPSPAPSANINDGLLRLSFSRIFSRDYAMSNSSFYSCCLSIVVPRLSPLHSCHVTPVGAPVHSARTELCRMISFKSYRLCSLF